MEIANIMRIPDVNVNFEGIKVACVGDSLTYGTTLLNRKVESYPARLAKMLGKDYNVLNLGFAGYAVNRQSSKSYLNLPYSKILEQYAPKYVVILLGTNDARSKNFTTENDFAYAYKSLFNSINNLSCKPQIIALTSPMAYVNNEVCEFDFSHDNLEKIIKLQRAILDEYKIPYIDLHNITQGKTSLYSDDMLHFNSKGAKFLAFKVFSAISDFEKKQIL
ncbi:MAG: GDSL-type esterase/lipase family protein [Clostridia bacterium]|nr:GDSL-type esterase/lipase family protein [Clostridia bacterium]